MSLNEQLMDAIGELGELDGEMVLAADERPGKRPRRRVWAALLPAAAAAAVLAALLLPGRLDGKPEGRLTTEELPSLESVAAYYEGTLLAENMVEAGARVTDIRLSHREDTALADVSGWDTLSFRMELDGERLDMSCAFDPPEEPDLPWEPTGTAEVGGVKVYLRLEPFSDWEERYSWSCKAAFVCDGVFYTMSVHLREPDDIYAYLRTVMGIPPQDPESVANRPFDSVLGFEDYRVTLEEYLPYQYAWHCWVTADGEERCAAENVFFFEDGFDAYSVDLDGDGVPELVANDVYTTGARRVHVFRYRDGKFLRGSPDRDFYRSGLGFSDEYGENAIEERYDPETRAFTVTFLEDGEARTETFGLERFVFSQFEHQEY